MNTVLPKESAPSIRLGSPADGKAGAVATGYLHPAYAASLGEFGSPLALPASGGWLLERVVPGTEWRDATGCYPLFCCKTWEGIENDLAFLESDLISVSLVTDPFGQFDEALLRATFDVVMPFKQHFVVDLAQAPEDFVSGRHQRNVAKGLERVFIEQQSTPSDWLDPWVTLYSFLVRRHAIRGLAAFSRRSFARQMAVPGLVAFRAGCDEETVGMLLWFRQGAVAYYHLGAFSERGYRVGASFALFWRAIEYFAEAGLRWLDLGGTAGCSLRGDAEDGLSLFKRGWSNARRPVWLCGRILNPGRYQELLQRRNLHGSYFPLYRQGEF
jgi:hypothetical protein